MKKNRIKKILFFLFVSIFIYAVINLFFIKKEIVDIQIEQEELIVISEVENINEDSNININFAELQKINPDIVGWIVFDGTSISHPIVQANNNSYYLNHSVYKEKNVTGSIFMDATADFNFQSKNTFIYGHSGIKHTMFSDLKMYMKKSFQEEHPYGFLYTPNGNYKVEIFSAYTAPANSNSYQLTYKDEDSFLNYIDIVKNKGYYPVDIDLAAEDKIITFYTCSYEFNNTKRDRYFIHGKLVEI